jgi:hypothetical protein
VRLDLQELKRLVCSSHPQAAAETVRSVWGEISLFMLKPEFRGSFHLVVPIENGATGAFFVWKQEELGTPLKDVFQPAFFLPMLWKANSQDSPCLPASLVQVAQSARKALVKDCRDDVDRRKAINGFGLHLADRLGDLYLTDLPCKAESAWAPLTAGLAITVYRGSPCDDVFATGAWDSDGIKQVDDIPEKVEAVVALTAARSRPMFFVPRANLGEALVAAGERAEIVAFPVGNRSANASLAEYLRKLAAPPRKIDGAILTERCAYANLDFIASDYGKRNDYYKSELLRDLADELATRSGEGFKIRRLALGLSKTWDLDAFLVRALKPAEVLFLTSPETTPALEGLKKDLMDLRATTFADPMELTAVNADECCARITTWLQATSSGSAVEITAGTKDMSAVLLVAARRSNTRILYLRHETRGPVPLYGIGNMNMVSLDWALR